jgi:isopropylmalate/homocitrate/citramalate synthase
MGVYKIKIKVKKSFEVTVAAKSEEEAFAKVKKCESDFTDTAYKANMTEINYASAKRVEPKVKKGKTLAEYMSKYGEFYKEGSLWDFSKEDIEDEAIFVDPDMVYWEIDGRWYETLEEE